MDEAILCEHCGSPLIRESDTGSWDVFVCPKCGNRVESHCTPALEDLGLQRDDRPFRVLVLLSEPDFEWREVAALRKLVPELANISLQDLKNTLAGKPYFEVGTFAYPFAWELSMRATDLGLLTRLEEIVK